MTRDITLNVTHDTALDMADTIGMCKIESLDNMILVNESGIDNIYTEFTNETLLSIVNMALVNFYLVTGKDAHSYKLFNMNMYRKNDPKYYEMIVNRLVNNTANLIILDASIDCFKKGVILYRNKTGAKFFQDESYETALINYVYSEITCSGITTYSCSDLVHLYFDHVETDVTALIELEKVIHTKQPHLSNMHLVVNTKNTFINSSYNNVIIISIN